MKKRRAPTVLATLALMAGLAVLEGSAAPGAHAANNEKGGYLSLGYGIYRDDSSLPVTVDQNRKASRIYLGYQFGDFLAAEVGYVDFTKMRYDFGGGLVTDVSAQGPHARAILSVPFSRNENAMNAFFVSAGALDWDVSEASTTTIRKRESATTVGAGLMFARKAAGVRLELEQYKTELSGGTEVKFNLWSANLLFYF